MPKSRTSRPELILLYIHFHFCSWIAICFLRVFFANQNLYSSVFRYWTLFFNDLKKLFKYFFISVFNYICIFIYMHPNQVLRKKWIEFGSMWNWYSLPVLHVISRNMYFTFGTYPTNLKSTVSLSHAKWMWAKYIFNLNSLMRKQAL